MLCGTPCRHVKQCKRTIPARSCGFTSLAEFLATLPGIAVFKRRGTLSYCLLKNAAQELQHSKKGAASRQPPKGKVDDMCEGEITSKGQKRTTQDSKLPSAKAKSRTTPDESTGSGSAATQPPSPQQTADPKRPQPNQSQGFTPELRLKMGEVIAATENQSVELRLAVKAAFGKKIKLHDAAVALGFKAISQMLRGLEPEFIVQKVKGKVLIRFGKGHGLEKLMTASESARMIAQPASAVDVMAKKEEDTKEGKPQKSGPHSFEQLAAGFLTLVREAGGKMKLRDLSFGYQKTYRQVRGTGLFSFAGGCCFSSVIFRRCTVLTPSSTTVDTDPMQTPAPRKLGFTDMAALAAVVPGLCVKIHRQGKDDVTMVELADGGGSGTATRSSTAQGEEDAFVNEEAKPRMAPALVPIHDTIVEMLQKRKGPQQLGPFHEQYRQETGSKIPYQDLGFQKLLQLIRTFEDIVIGKIPNGLPTVALADRARSAPVDRLMPAPVPSQGSGEAAASTKGGLVVSLGANASADSKLQNEVRTVLSSLGGTATLKMFGRTFERRYKRRVPLEPFTSLAKQLAKMDRVTVKKGAGGDITVRLLSEGAPSSPEQSAVSAVSQPADLPAREGDAAPAAMRDADKANEVVQQLLTLLKGHPGGMHLTVLLDNYSKVHKRCIPFKRMGFEGGMVGFVKETAGLKIEEVRGLKMVMPDPEVKLKAEAGLKQTTIGRKDQRDELRTAAINQAASEVLELVTSNNGRVLLRLLPVGD